MRNVYTRPWACLGRSALALLLALSALMARSAHAENYPDHPVKIIVPFAAGGTADAIPRRAVIPLSGNARIKHGERFYQIAIMVIEGGPE